MARPIHILDTLKIAKATEQGMHSDGGGLYLRVGPTGAKSWVFRYMVNGQSHDMGLGPLHTISLEKARESAREARERLLSGDDPIGSRLAAHRVKREVRAITFQWCAEQYIAAKETGWKGARQKGGYKAARPAKNWRTTLTKPGHIAGVYETLGPIPVRDINREMVLGILTREMPGGGTLWNTYPAMAGELRRRIEKVLGWAKARIYRQGDNPAAWKDNLEHELPSPKTVRPVTPQPALRSYKDISKVFVLLGQQKSLGVPAAQFTALIPGRVDAVANARFDEFDLDEEKVWTVPAARMKALGKDFRVPLSAAAIALVRKQKKMHRDGFVFPGQSPHTAVSEQTVLDTIQAIEWPDRLTTHGLRASFTTWAYDAEEDFRPDIIEMALGHKVGNETYEAYQRGDLFNKRRVLMNAWEKIVLPASARSRHRDP